MHWLLWVYLIGAAVKWTILQPVLWRGKTFNTEGVMFSIIAWPLAVILYFFGKEEVPF